MSSIAYKLQGSLLRSDGRPLSILDALRVYNIVLNRMERDDLVMRCSRNLPFKPNRLHNVITLLLLYKRL